MTIWSPDPVVGDRSNFEVSNRTVTLVLSDVYRILNMKMGALDFAPLDAKENACCYSAATTQAHALCCATMLENG